MMNCKKVRQLLAAFTLGELDLGLHQKIEGHVAGCHGCSAELKAMERDVLKISSTLGSEILPPSGLMTGMAQMLPDRPRRWSLRLPSLRAGLVVAIACSAMLFALLMRPATTPRIEALVLADVPVTSQLMTDSDGEVAKSLASRTGIEVTPISLSPKDRFEGGTCVKLDGREVPVMFYSLDGKRVAYYQVGADSLHTTGMTPMEMRGQKFFCCSHNNGALVAIRAGNKAYVFSGQMDEISLARLAMKVVS